MKKCIKTMVALLLLSFFISDVSQAKALKDKNACLALNYHRIREDNLLDRVLSIFSNSKELKIYSVTNTAFDRQMRWLKNHDAHFVTLDELLRYKEKEKFPKRCVWVNFDDMDRSIYLHGQPILKKYNIPATGFVITGEIGNPDFHNIPLANTEELQELKDSGLWTFQTHTHDLHANENNESILTLPKNKGKIYHDLMTSKKVLEQSFDEKVKAIAYPYGHANDDVIEKVHKAGIEYGFTLEDDVITTDSHNDYLPRVLVSETSFENVVKTWEGFK